MLEQEVNLTLFFRDEDEVFRADSIQCPLAGRSTQVLIRSGGRFASCFLANR